MPTAIVADTAHSAHPSPSCDTPSTVLTGDAVDLISQLWQPRFPSGDLVALVADLFPQIEQASRHAWLTEGPRPFIRIGPGVVEVRSKDYAKAERAAEREQQRREMEVELLAQYVEEHGRFPDEPKPTRVISEWSKKSRTNMVRSMLFLDFAPMYADVTRLPAMITLTYPGDWLTVAPSGRAVKRHMKALRKRYERAWGETFRCVWKLEFQWRGAPHIHMLMPPPHGTVDGLMFREWLSRAWADVVAHPDPAEYAKHLLAGTAVDYAEGLKARDPKRVAVYFLKHAQFRDKEYQNIVPEAWAEPGNGPGRFWGYWGLEKISKTVELDQEDGVIAGRTLRRWSAAQQVSREVTRPRVKGGRVISKYAEVQGLAGAYLMESRGAPKYRKTRTRARRMRGNRGFVAVNNGVVLAEQLARYLMLRHTSVDQ